MNKKKIAGEAVKDFIKDGMVIGLGTGSTAYYAIHAIGDLVKEGVNIQGVATSKTTELLARELGIPLLPIDDVTYIDLAIDGVDEIDYEFNAIKGGGGALFREKVVASLANEVIWIMDDTKLVDSIGKFPLPVEVARYGHKQVYQKLEAYGMKPEIRRKNKEYFITDNGNYIIDLHLREGFQPKEVISKLSKVVGILEHGLFCNTCNSIIVGCDTGVKIIDY